MKKYYDIPLTLRVIISVKAESKDQAKKKIVDTPNSELLEIVKEQSVFLDDDLESGLAH
jgi:hypothetical protein